MRDIIYWPFGEQHCFANGAFLALTIALYEVLAGFFFHLGFNLLK